MKLRYAGTPVSGAFFTQDNLYRFSLWRNWAPGKPMLWIMLNPSTADEVANDPTVERCERRAVKGDYGGLEVCNVFAFRSTDPRKLKQVDDPVGPGNDGYILGCAERAKKVVCAWGNLAGTRGIEVAKMLMDHGIKLYHLGLTKMGHPRHPLYVPYEKQLEAWTCPYQLTKKNG